jgi:hypothetical protein
MNIDAIKGQFKDYARSNLFIVRFGRTPHANETEPEAKGLFDKLKTAALKAIKSYFEVPAALQDEMINFGVKSCVFPSVTMTPAELEWRGFKMPTVGVPTFQDVTMTFLIDHDMIIYNYFLRWLDQIVSSRNGAGVTALTNHADLITNIDIYQLKGDLSVNNSYMVSLMKAYPISIGEITLNESDSFSEFNVTFRYTNIKNDNLGEEIKRSDKDTTSLLDRAKGFIGGLIP